ncbi:MAG: ribosome silencing factor [Saprospiraceae bacterium]
MSTTTNRAAAVFNTRQELVHEIIVDSIQDIKGKNIVRLDLRKLDAAPADFFFICEADSSVQVNSIAERVRRRLRTEVGEAPSNPANYRESKTWICLDYFDTIVHVFYHEAREFYDLEDLWSDADVTEYAAA